MERAAHTAGIDSPQALTLESKLGEFQLSEKTKNFATSRNYYQHYNLAKLTPDLIHREEQESPVAYHERGHQKIARRLGWGVSFITIEPNGNILGVTKLSPPGNSREQQLKEFICIAYGGMMGEECNNNHDHRGCGSDMAKANYFAHILAFGFYQGRVSPESILSEQKSRARSLVGGSLEQESMELVARRTICYN